MRRGAITIQANICMLPRGPGLMPRSCPEAGSTMSSLQRAVTWSESRETGFAPGVVLAWSLWAHSWRFPETISYSQGIAESTSDPRFTVPIGTAPSLLSGGRQDSSGHAPPSPPPGCAAAVPGQEGIHHQLLKERPKNFRLNFSLLFLAHDGGRVRLTPLLSSLSEHEHAKAVLNL